jgi:WD40 repeat protein
MVHINLKCVAVEEEIREVFNSRISFDKLNAGKRNKLDTPFWCPETLFRKASEFEDLKGVIVWSPNGKSMLTYDNILPIFNILNIECRTFDEISFGGIKKIGGLSFNREGTLLAWATLDIGSSLLIANLELKGVRFLNWIDSKQLLIVFTRNGAIRVDITNNIASTLLDTPILSADFSSTLSLIASSRESDYSISLTKLNTLTKVSLEGHTEGVKTLKWSPNGDLLLSYSWDNTIKIWDGKTNVLIQTLTFQCRITSTSWSHDQKYVATADSTRRIAIWDIRTGECIASAYGTFALWSPAESVIATRNLAEKTLCCWSLL